MEWKLVTEIHDRIGTYLRGLSERGPRIEFPRPKYFLTVNGYVGSDRPIPDTYVGLSILISEDSEDIKKFIDKTDELRKEIGAPEIARDFQLKRIHVT